MMMIMPSYPYLALSRRLGVDYGTVLWYAHYLEEGEAPPGDRPRPLRVLTRAQQVAAGEVWQAEHDRQLEVSRGC